MIRTIAIHTLRESFRKKTLHVLIGLGILIMAILPAIPTTDEPDARIKMAMVVFFQVVVLLCITGVILLSATALPHEIEDKTVYGILSKPVSRLKLVAGKITGFVLLSALLLVVLSSFNLVSIQYRASNVPEEYRGILKARTEFAASHFSIQGKLHHARQGIAWIAGGRSGIALWSFSDIKKTHTNTSGLDAECNLKLESDRGFIDTIPLMITVEDGIAGYGKTEVRSAQIDKPFVLKIDPERVLKNDTLNISIFPILPTDYIGATQIDVKVFSTQKGFVSNYGKAVIITFMKFLLIISIAVMGSTYLSAPVSIAAAFVVFLCGHILEFIKDFSLLIQDHHAHEHAVPGVLKTPNILLVYVDHLIKKPLEWICSILPDFKRFDGLKFLLKGINIPLETVVVSFGYAVVYAGICLFLSAIILKKREFF